MPHATPELTPLDPKVKAGILAQAADLIAARRVCWLASMSPDGFPVQRGMGYVPDGWRISMSTTRNLRKAGEIAADPRVSLQWSDPAVRHDHFVQIHGYAVPVQRAEFAVWQERRFERYPQERAIYGDAIDEWVGWIIEPVRLRALGYIKERIWWGEVPVVFGRRELGLPPLQRPAPAIHTLSEYSYVIADIAREVAFWDARA